MDFPWNQPSSYWLPPWPMKQLQYLEPRLVTAAGTSSSLFLPKAGGVNSGCYCDVYPPKWRNEWLSTLAGEVHSFWVNTRISFTTKIILSWFTLPDSRARPFFPARSSSPSFYHIGPHCTPSFMVSEPQMTTENYIGSMLNLTWTYLNPIWNCWCMIGKHQWFQSPSDHSP